MPAFSRSARAVRLVFATVDDELRLVSQQPVDLDLPPLTSARAPAAGSYLELHDESGVVLGRVSVGREFAAVTEVVPEVPGGPITVISDRTSDAFTVVVRRPAAATEVVAVRVAPNLAGGAGAGFVAVPRASTVTEIGRFTLEDSGSDRADD